MAKEDLETEAFRKGKKNVTCKDREVRPIRTGHQIKNKFLKGNQKNTKITKLPNLHYSVHGGKKQFFHMIISFTKVMTYHQAST